MTTLNSLACGFFVALFVWQLTAGDPSAMGVSREFWMAWDAGWAVTFGLLSLTRRAKG